MGEAEGFKVVNLLLTCIFLPYMASASVLVHDNKWEPRPRPYKYWADLQKDPVFHPDNVKDVVVARHSIAFIPCKIIGLVDHSVSWFHKPSSMLLTVDDFVYTTDKRISSHINEERTEQVLMITDVNFEDEGEYTCQVSTQPAISLNFHLHVIIAVAMIKGKKERYLNSGEDIVLRCTIPRLTYSPEYFLWYLGNNIYTYEDKENVEVITESKTRSSKLVIHNAQVSDSGNYTCTASNARPSHVIVHVVPEEVPSAIHHEDSSGCTSTSERLQNFLLIVIYAVFVT
ncbi:leucine-rich repeats and immunoglobulin-like domains protein 1 [Palaemon carinicauda]|uniref:leucine-rich repeats and immunoglobulin-like domains protein 1 n=1 Tax=Palaemon carinicauda TaxID=392227 RepID=UPI0035B5D603